MKQQSSTRVIQLSHLLKYLAKKWKILSSILPLKSKTLREHQLPEETTISVDTQIQEETTISVDTQLPDEITISVDAELISEDIILEIISRLPVKTILKARSVSKPWLSLISEPSFHKFQFSQATAAHRTALLISAYDTHTRERYLLSAAHEGGPVTHLMTPDAQTITRKETTEVEYLNGLVLFSSGNGFIEHNFAFVLNPSTHKIFKLHGPASEPDFLSYGDGYICYFFGFDESGNEHKVLTIRMFVDPLAYSFRPKTIEIMIFSLSNLSWRKIDQDLPSNIVRDWNVGTKHSVCVNSIIHLILQNRNQILTFDLRTEKFSIINFPVDAIRNPTNRDTCKKRLNTIISNQPFLMKINGFLGLVCHNPVACLNKLDIWILIDYEYGLWMKESVSCMKSWFLVDGPFALNPFISNNFMVTNRGMRMINVPMYDLEGRSFKSVEFELGYHFLHHRNIRFDHVRSYIESMLPLPSNQTST